ncbi:MAG: phosphatase PAP2 family protein [Bacteroidales bacterium]|nr:phosphatase PAP2 family protein [Bacteroidales bacterium]MDE7357342.1 phosphatase PAP2 family protein [Bacteroidales bacterium]
MSFNLIDIDKAITVAVNNWRSDWADQLMVTLSGTWVWAPLYAFLIGLMIYTYRRASWVVVLGVILLVGMADWTSVHFFKNVFMRLRPSRDPSLEGLLFLPHGRGGLYGFVSSHAANLFAIASYVTWVLKKRFKIFGYGVMYVWAAVIGYSRIYLARHFFGDVLCGALWGVLLAWGMAWLIRTVLSKAYPSACLYLCPPPKKSRRKEDCREVVS